MSRITIRFIALFLAAFLGWAAGRSYKSHEITDPEIVVDTVFIERPDTLSEWDLLKMAIIFTESKGNPEAIGKDGDWGAMQLRDIYVREARRISGMDYKHQDAFDVQKSLEMFEIIQSHYNPEEDVDSAIRLHNKGNWGIYRKNMEIMRRMDNIRTIIIGGK